MRLKPTSFSAIFADGPVRLDGHAFKVNGRELVVHKARPQILVIDKTYKISAAVGFAIPINPTEDRRAAVAFAYDEVPKISDEEWRLRSQLAERAQKNLKIVEG